MGGGPLTGGRTGQPWRWQGLGDESRADIVTVLMVIVISSSDHASGLCVTHLFSSRENSVRWFFFGISLIGKETEAQRG